MRFVGLLLVATDPCIPLLIRREVRMLGSVTSLRSGHVGVVLRRGHLAQLAGLEV